MDEMNNAEIIKDVEAIARAAHAEGFAEGIGAAAKISMASKYNGPHWRTISGHSTHCHRGLSISNEILALKPKKEMTNASDLASLGAPGQESEER